MFQPWPWLACCMCEGARCVCPHIWRGMAGEGTIRNMHQGEASSAIAKTELQEHCLPVLHVHIREWPLWAPSSSPAELLVWKGLCRGQWPSSWMSEAGWMCENKIPAIVTPFFAGSLQKSRLFQQLISSVWGDTSRSLVWQSLCRQFWLFVRWGCYLHIEKELRRLQLQLCISVPRTLQKCFPVYMCERVSILVITQLQTMRPKSRG